MNLIPKFSILLVCSLTIGGFVFSQEEATPKPARKRIRKVKRVARPDFSEEAEKEIYFRNIFQDALVGDRPSSKNVESTAGNVDSNSSGEGDGKFRWSGLIDGPTIEDEVKSLNQQLARLVTTSVKFKTTYNDVRQAMSLLSMAFALIREYDGEVRWKEHASAAQAALEKAATNSRSNSDQAFNYAKGRKFDLEDLIRGGAFPESEKPSDKLDWSSVIGRSETMVRLEKADNQLKQWTADKKTFARQKSKIVSEAQWVAAIAQVIAREGMDDADVEEYVEFCTQMKKAALQTIAATRSDDFEAAGKFSNLLSQSCNNCHEEWR